MIVIAGTVQVHPDKRERAIEIAREMAVATQREPGCRSYTFYSDLADPARFFLFEEWEDDAALTAHFQTEHVARFGAQLPEVLGGAPSFQRYEVESVSKLM